MTNAQALAPDGAIDAICHLVDEAQRLQSDVDGFTGLLTDDAVIVDFGGRRVRGRAAIRAAMEQALASPLVVVEHDGAWRNRSGPDHAHRGLTSRGFGASADPLPAPRASCGRTPAGVTAGPPASSVRCRKQEGTIMKIFVAGATGALGWQLRYPSWRQGFVEGLR